MKKIGILIFASLIIIGIFYYLNFNDQEDTPDNSPDTVITSEIKVNEEGEEYSEAINLSVENIKKERNVYYSDVHPDGVRKVVYIDQNGNEVEICKTGEVLEYEQLVKDCVSLAKYNNDVEICENIVGENELYVTNKNYCYFELARSSLNYSLCENIIFSNENKDKCYGYIGTRTKNLELCEKAGQQEISCKNSYYSDFVTRNKDTDDVLGGIYYIIDNNNIYSLHSRYTYDAGNIFEADSESFKLINKEYTKDKNNVYYFGYKLPEVDPKTFEIKEIDEKIFGLDEKDLYLGDLLLEGINPDNFKIEEGNQGGSIIYDEDTNWYLKGTCDYREYVSEDEMREYFKNTHENLKEGDYKTNYPFKEGWDNETYLEKYSIC